MLAHDYPTADAALDAARSFGATYISGQGKKFRIYMRLRNGEYCRRTLFQKHGNWHIGAHVRTCSTLPEDTRRIDDLETKANPLTPTAKHVLVGAGVASFLLIVIGLKNKYGAATKFGAAVVSDAQNDVGVQEGSARVTQMLANYGINQPVNWCAVAVGTWIRESAQSLGVQPPILGSASAKSTMVQFQNPSNPKVGWYSASELLSNPNLIQPGMIVVWQRGPTASWFGHIGVVSSRYLGNNNFRSIEGNAGPGAGAVVENIHDLTAASLLGMGYFNDNAIFNGSSTQPGVAGLSGTLGQLPPGLASQTVQFTPSNVWLNRVAIVTKPADRAQGLMNINYLPQDQGMWFDFGKTHVQPFWMKNTRIPLDIIFLSDNFVIVGILENMRPHDLTLRTVGIPSRYAIEVNAGFVKRHGIRVGQKASPVRNVGMGYIPDPPDEDTFAPPGA